MKIILFCYVAFGYSVGKSCHCSSVTSSFPYFHPVPHSYIGKIEKDNCMSGEGTGRSCEPSLQHQKNVLNSNDPASTSACDSVRAQTGEESKVRLEMSERGVMVVDKNNSGRRSIGPDT